MITTHLLAEQRTFFSQQNTKAYDFRIASLKKLAATIRRYEPQIMDALWKDLHKSAFESYATEVGFVLSEISDTIKHLKRWMKPKGSNTPLTLFGSKSKVICEPYGVVLILSAWNYPFQLLLSPLVGAIAAGNCAILKPSPLAPNVAAIMELITKECFPKNYVALVHVENESMDKLLSERFDYIFYTGGVNYGRHIMQMAAIHLTPITLELGGKSPCVIDKDANLPIAARRIVWGKFMNAGQTCVAPDYLLVHHEVEEKLIHYLIEEITKQYGTSPKESPDYIRMISDGHYQRLANLLKHGEIVSGGEVIQEQKYIAPTLLINPEISSELMTEEIFGPILPIITFTELSEVISFINAREKPLALYYFTESSKRAHSLISQTSSGGACVNDVVIQVANTDLPFGGVGNSGMGNYHGIHGFRTFSHQRAVIYSPTWFNIGIKFAPYKSKLQLLKRVMK